VPTLKHAHSLRDYSRVNLQTLDMSGEVEEGVDLFYTICLEGDGDDNKLALMEFPDYEESRRIAQDVAGLLGYPLSETSEKYTEDEEI